MRIAHVSDFYLPRLGGIETHIAELAARQRRAGHHVDVVTVVGGATDLSHHGRVIAAVPAGTHLAHFRPGALTASSESITAGRYDVVHVHAGLVTPMAFTVAARASAAGLPTVVTAHSLVSYLYPAYRAADALTRWSRWP